MMKLDMSKAYDRLSWRFLLRVMRAFGFSHQWCDLVYRNLSNCWYSIVSGGKSFDFFKSNRGVRQGDPLSPSLFIPAMDYFSRLYNSLVMNNKIKSYIVPSGIPPLHHLLYVDDLLLFISGRKDYVRKLTEIINNFCGVSRQMLNPDKVKYSLLRISMTAEGAPLLISHISSWVPFVLTIWGLFYFPARPKLATLLTWGMPSKER
ncbi:unnamed protein product [Rhodiola kirilowii]